MHLNEPKRTQSDDKEKIVEKHNGGGYGGELDRKHVYPTELTRDLDKR